MAPHIFMLEDDTAITGLVRSAIENEGWRFGFADRVEGVLDAIRRDRSDIVLLDVHLPDGNGYEVCQELRKDPALAKIPVLFLTVKDDVHSRLKGFAAGGQDYIAKPFELEELVARLRAHLDIKKRLDDLTRQNTRLTVHQRIQQDLTDMIIHDLRAPVGTIQITLRILRESGLVTDGDKARLLRNAEGTAEFLLLMVSDLLDVKAGRLEVRPEPLNLSSLLSRLEGLVGPQMRQKQIALQLEQPESLPKFVTDPTLLFRILVNLLNNACKFSNSGSRVGLKIDPSRESLHFEVSDEGPGIPDTAKERIFEKGYRGDTAATPGTGLGLAFCRMAVEALVGTIRVEDRETGGSRFVVSIPSLATGVSS